MTHRYLSYIQSPEWKAIAEQAKDRAGRRCQLCNSPDRLEAHHRTYAHLGNEADHMGDLTCLCHSCHTNYHWSKGTATVNTSTNITYPGVAAASAMNGTKIVLTKGLINACETDRGGLTDATIAALGVNVNNKVKGWRDRLVGTAITVMNYSKALEGRYHRKPVKK